MFLPIARRNITQIALRTLQSKFPTTPQNTYYYHSRTIMTTTTAQNDLAKSFKALHIPGNPLILTNVWDAITARSVASLPGTKALATASYAIAAAAGVADEELSLAENLRAVTAIAKVANESKKPLTVDFQDGFEEQLEEGVRELLKAGVVGLNLEDFSRKQNKLYPVTEAIDRIKRVLAVAKEHDVPDFVVNARSDAYLTAGNLDEAIERGKAYLDAGATTVYILAGPNKFGHEEVGRASKELRGMLNIGMSRMKKGGLEVSDLSEIGIARISVGPQIMLRMMKFVEEEAGRILAGEPAS